jgi:hypothetical protein
MRVERAIRISMSAVGFSLWIFHYGFHYGFSRIYLKLLLSNLIAIFKTNLDFMTKFNINFIFYKINLLYFDLDFFINFRFMFSLFFRSPIFINLLMDFFLLI